MPLGSRDGRSQACPSGSQTAPPRRAPSTNPAAATKAEARVGQGSPSSAAIAAQDVSHAAGGVSVAVDRVDLAGLDTSHGDVEAECTTVVLACEPGLDPVPRPLVADAGDGDPRMVRGRRDVEGESVTEIQLTCGTEVQRVRGRALHPKADVAGGSDILQAKLQREPTLDHRAVPERMGPSQSRTRRSRSRRSCAVRHPHRDRAAWGAEWPGAPPHPPFHPGRTDAVLAQSSCSLPLLSDGGAADALGRRGDRLYERG